MYRKCILWLSKTLLSKDLRGSPTPREKVGFIERLEIVRSFLDSCKLLQRIQQRTRFYYRVYDSRNRRDTARFHLEREAHGGSLVSDEHSVTRRVVSHRFSCACHPPRAPIPCAFLLHDEMMLTTTFTTISVSLLHLCDLCVATASMCKAGTSFVPQPRDAQRVVNLHRCTRQIPRSKSATHTF